MKESKKQLRVFGAVNVGTICSAFKMRDVIENQMKNVKFES